MEKDNQRNNSNKVLLTVIGTATLLTAMVGATFAYFSATSTSDTKIITTATSSLTVTANKNTVANIRPTTWDATKKDTDTEIVKMTVDVDGTSTASGKYSLYLNQPDITIKSLTDDQGVVGDFKWVAYDATGNQLVEPTSLKATEESVLIPGKDGANALTYTKAYTATDGATATIDDTYYVYVWIENKDADQNNLQEVSFDINFTATGTTANN